MERGSPVIELTVMSGPDLGRRLRASTLPVRVGRSTDADLQLMGPGVWDHHFALLPTPEGRIGIRVTGDARVAVCSEAIREAPLRNGAILEVGGILVRFGISDEDQRPLKWRERWAWMMMMTVLVLQAGLIWWTGR